MPTASWLIGSVKGMAAQSMSVNNGSGAEGVSVPTGSYYLYDPADARSLIDAVAAAINSHTGLSGATVTIRRDRKVELNCSTAFSVTWTSATLRDLLGFTGNLGSSTVHAAPNVSPLLWSPGKPDTPRGRIGSDGWYVYDTAVGQAGPGRVTSTSVNRYRKNSLQWRYVTNSRVWDANESGGTYFKFFDEVLRKFANFKMYRSIPEDDASTTDVTFPSPIPSGNAYVFDAPRFPIEFPYSREFEGIESLHPVELDVVEAPEF